VESALVAHPKCAEAAVVGYEHPIKGQGIYAYVTLMEGQEPTEDIRRELINTVRGIIGAFAAPDVIHWVRRWGELLGVCVCGTGYVCAFAAPDVLWGRFDVRR
jgi:acyl-CoA synthetase (AMP-forming)/AMP-acid ligase II